MLDSCHYPYAFSFSRGHSPYALFYSTSGAPGHSANSLSVHFCAKAPGNDGLGHTDGMYWVNSGDIE